jgi:hypothetical protein
MLRLDRLFVLWSDPGQGRRHVVGQLWRDHRGHAFAYSEELGDALAAGFRPVAEFPEPRGEDDPYRARQLFWTFAERIPSPRRPDYAQLMASWGVEHPDDQFEVLAMSGGVQATDRLEVSEYRPADDDLSTELLFRLAGERHGAGADDLKTGDDLQLWTEPGNRYDPCATQVLFKGDRKIGYVPIQYSCLFSRLLDAGREIRARAVRRLVLPEERGRWMISARAAP